MATIVIKKEKNGISFQRDGGTKYNIFSNPTKLFSDKDKIILRFGGDKQDFWASDTITLNDVPFAGTASEICDKLRDDVFFLASGGGGGAETQLKTVIEPYTLTVDDVGFTILVDSVVPINLTVPNDTNVLFDSGTLINIIQFGDGQVAIAPQAGVTLYSADNAKKSRTKFASITLIKKTANEWFIIGDIVA